VRVDFTRNRAEVRDSLASLRFPGFKEANLFDAIIDTLDKLEPVNGRKSILLLSTGANTFGVATFDELQKRLKATDVTIFTVGLAEEEYTRSLNTKFLSARLQVPACLFNLFSVGLRMIAESATARILSTFERFPQLLNLSEALPAAWAPARTVPDSLSGWFRAGAAEVARLSRHPASRLSTESRAEASEPQPWRAQLGGE
jgi:hypothetical protein